MAEPDRRRKNRNFRVADETGKLYEPFADVASLAVLMDLRDELQTLNAVFACQNFQNVPRELRAINRELKIIRKATKNATR